MTNDPAGRSGASEPLEDLVAGALEALDRGGDAALAAFLDARPEHRAAVLALVTPFRATGLLARDGAAMPERLGDFRLLQRLGSGGMGVVFLAEQASLRRTVALKVIRPDLLFFEGARQRFRREIEVIARLSHAAIVPIVATGEHDGVPWYAMQLVAGCSAEEAVRRLLPVDPTRLDGSDLARAIRGPENAPGDTDATVFAGSYWEACVRLVRQAALGLEHAHAQGIVHRDVKPSNVMLTPDGRALLVDFGLALVQGDARLTVGAGEPGSPAYMAPEQVRGLGADERSDVYSLAATLVQLLDLQAPFAAGDAEHLRAQIVLGQRSSPRNRAVPRELRVVLAAAMDIDRERRYPSAGAFAEDLAAVLARRPIAAGALPCHVRIARWAQRHRTTAAVLVAAALVAAVLPGVLAWQRGAALATLQQQKQLAERSRDQALQAVRSFLVKFASSDLETSPGGLRIANALLGEARTILDNLPEVDDQTLLLHRTQVERWLVSGLAATGRHTEARELAFTLLARWPEDRPRPPDLAALLAGVRLSLLHLDAKGIPIGDDEAVFAAAMRDLARVRADPGHTRVATQLEAAFAQHRGLRWRVRGDLPRAAEELRSALQLLEHNPEPDDDWRQRVAEGRNRLAEVLCRQGQYDEAQQLFTETVAQMAPPGDRVLSPPENLPLWSYAVWGLAQVATCREQWTDAQRLYGAAIELAETCASCFAENDHYRSVLASMLTEFGQVQNVVAADPTAGRVVLERARVLFDSLTGTAQTASNRENRHTNFRLLAVVYGRQRDHAALAALAGAHARFAEEPAELANAAWNLLLAAGLADAAGERDAAVANDRLALDALLACDRAGWFQPVDLDAAPCQRLVGFPEFQALRSKHPPAAVQKVRLAK